MKKYRRLTENAAKPQGFWGRLMIRSMNKGHDALTDWGLSHVAVENGFHALDVGCGGGKTVDKLCQRVGSGKVYGIDYAELCVKKAQKLNYRNLLCQKADIRQASVSALPFDNDSFDLVTAVETYYFWPDKAHDLGEIRRVVKPGGKLLLVFEMVTSADDPGRWKAVEDRLHIKAVSADEISGMLSAAGWRNIQTDIRDGNGWLCAVAEKERQ